MRWRDAEAAPARQVTSVEVFFDIVFVFTLAQLTRILERDLSLKALGHCLLLFGILWWMYAGYVWLCNHVPPRRVAQKLLLFVAMAGFLLAAIALPKAFETTGLLFAVGYLIVITVHLVLFTQSNALEGVKRLLPFNLGAALLAVAGALAGGGTMYALWIAAFLLQSVVPYLVPRYSWISASTSFHLEPEHFVERHGLLVLIALGESVIAIGMGVDPEHLTPITVGSTMLALALPGTLFWTYFTDAANAEHALAHTDDGARSQLAVRAYFFAHIPMLLGIVVTAAGIHGAIAHPDHAVSWPAAVALAGGIALFLLGIAEFSRCMNVGTPISRFVAAAAVIATIPVGAMLNAGSQLGAVVAIVFAMLILAPRRYVPH